MIKYLTIIFLFFSVNLYGQTKHINSFINDTGIMLEYVTKKKNYMVFWNDIVLGDSVVYISYKENGKIIIDDFSQVFLQNGLDPNTKRYKNKIITNRNGKNVKYKKEVLHKIHYRQNVGPPSKSYLNYGHRERGKSIGYYSKKYKVFIYRDKYKNEYSYLDDTEHLKEMEKNTKRYIYGKDENKGCYPLHIYPKYLKDHQRSRPVLRMII